MTRRVYGAAFIVVAALSVATLTRERQENYSEITTEHPSEATVSSAGQISGDGERGKVVQLRVQHRDTSSFKDTGLRFETASRGRFEQKRDTPVVNSDEPVTADRFVVGTNQANSIAITLHTPPLRSCFKDCVTPYGVTLQSDPSVEPPSTFSGAAAPTDKPARDPTSSEPIAKIPITTSLAPSIAPTSDAPLWYKTN